MRANYLEHRRREELDKYFDFIYRKRRETLISPPLPARKPERFEHLVRLDPPPDFDPPCNTNSTSKTRSVVWRALWWLGEIRTSNNALWGVTRYVLIGQLEHRTTRSAVWRAMWWLGEIKTSNNALCGDWMKFFSDESYVTLHMIIDKPRRANSQGTQKVPLMRVG